MTETGLFVPDEPLDRFGQPIPVDPGYKEIWNADGSKPRSWEKLVLGDGLTVTSDVPNKASVLGITLPTAGQTVQNIQDVVTSLRSMATLPANGTTFITRAFNTSRDDLGSAFYRWVLGNADADDGALTIASASLPGGRFKYVDTNGGIFPLTASEIDMTGATSAGAALQALVTKLVAQGYRGCDGRNGTCKLTAEFTMPPRALGVGFEFVGFKFTGTGSLSGPFGPTLNCKVKTESDLSLINGGYSVHAWNGAVVAGQVTFVGVEVRAGLTVGASVVVNTGADPTNIGGAYDQFWAKIKTVVNTSGTTATITIDRPVPRTPVSCNGVLHSVPTWNENITRTSARHDMILVTEFQDNLVFTDCTFDDCWTDLNGTRNCRVVRPVVNRSYFCFRLVVATDTLFDSPVIENLTGGFPEDLPNYSANYGFIFTNYGSRGTKVHNFTGRNIEASGGVWDEELQGDGAHFTGTTRAHFSNATDAGIHSGWFVGNRLTNQITIDRLLISGDGHVVNNGRVNIGHLEMLGPPSMLTTDVTRIGSMRWNGEEWNTPKTALVDLRGLAVSTTNSFLIPVRGILRSLRLFASSLTGVSDVLLVREDSGTFSIMSFLTAAGAAAWAECDTFLTALGFSFATFGGRITGIQVVTDGSFVLGTYLLADVQMLTPSRSLDNQTFVDVSLPEKISGQGRPSINAQYIGQEYTDNISGVVYHSRSVGYAARDWSRAFIPAFGSYLSDSDQTLTPGGTAGEYLLENGIHSTTRTKTISTSGATAGDRIIITSYETASHTMVIVNGGAGAGTLYTFAGVIPQQLSLVFDGTNWGSMTVIPVQ